MDELLTQAKYLISQWPQKSDQELAENVKAYFEGFYDAPATEVDTYINLIKAVRSIYEYYIPSNYAA
ncbi:MAG: hypothetical protein R3B45_14700 [Bdellovibrionota bacterium]